jgi:succinate dehydrogenase cytochrome b556 subunit
MTTRRDKTSKTLESPKTYPNRRGVIGWIDSRHLNLERYFYSMHRLAGLAIVGYLFVHVYVTSIRLQGPVGWDALLRIVENPLIYAGEWLLVAVVAFHGLNGIRLILAEAGLSIGKPVRPIYPYRPTSLGRRQRYFILLLMIIGGIFLIAAALEYLIYVPLASYGG